MPDPSLVPWWQLPMPPASSFVVVRDVPSSTPAWWSYFVQPVATVLAIGGAYLVARLQAKSVLESAKAQVQGALDVANKNAETQLAAATKTSEATLRAALANVEDAASARHDADIAAEKRDAEARARHERALRAHTGALYIEACRIILVEMAYPAASEDQKDRATVLQRFVDRAYNVDLAAVYDDESLRVLYHAASTIESVLRVIGNMVISEGELTDLDREHLVKTYATKFEALILCCDGLGQGAYKANMLADFTKVKKRHPKPWFVT